MTNPSTFFAGEDLGEVLSHTHCVRVDELAGVARKVTLALKIVKWIREIPPIIPP